MMHVAAALLALVVQAPGKGDPLEEAKRLLEGPAEGTFRRGAATCLERNDGAAAELLLKKLAGSQPHFRDLAFEYLEKLSNPYALAVVEQAAAQHRDERVRAWCCDLLGAYAGKARTDPLHQGLQDASPLVKEAAARALGRLQGKPSAGRLAPLKVHADPLVRATALRAWALCDPKTNGVALAPALKDKDAGVRAAVLAALAEAAPMAAEGRALASLADPDWRVRLQAAETLSRQRTRSAVAALVSAADDGRRIVAGTAERGLAELTGERFHGGRAWRAWWEAKGDGFEFPKNTESRPASAPASEDTGVFFGLPVDSDHVAFLIDRGATMGNASPGGGGTKMEQVRAELGKTLRSLPSGTRFNVLAYSNDVRAWEKKPQPVGEKPIAAALEWLGKQPLAGRKDIWAALEAVLADADVDTAYLMSDGEPEDGLYVHHNRVIDHLRRANVLRKLVIHTVHVSDPSWGAATTEWYRSQLREIAKGTGGKYVEL